MIIKIESEIQLPAVNTIMKPDDSRPHEKTWCGWRLQSIRHEHIIRTGCTIIDKKYVKGLTLFKYYSNSWNDKNVN